MSAKLRNGEGLSISINSNSNNSCYRVGLARVRNYKKTGVKTTYFFSTYKEAIAFYNMKGGTNYK